MSANTPLQPATTPARRRRRLLPWLALGLAPVLVGGGAVAAQAHKSVDLEIDGQTQTVSTFAGSVAGLLQEHGVEVGEHDLVAPGADSALSEGLDVVVRSAHLVTVEVNGEHRQIWTTAETAGEIVAGMFEGGRDVTMASRSLDRQGLDLPLVVDGEVVVVADGERTRVELAGAGYVRDALEAAGVTAARSDRVEVGATKDGTVKVTVTRVVRGERTETKPVKFDTVRRQDDSLYEGQTRVLRKGSAGERTITFDTITVDGEEVWSKRTGAKVTTKPTDRVIAVGTAQRPAPQPVQQAGSGAASSGSSSSSSTPSSSGASGSAAASTPSAAPSPAPAPSSAPAADTSVSGVWARLAQCESGGNPTIVSASGTYHGLYQFSVATWQSVGGSGLPSQASPAEQTKRAQMLQARSGWGQWPHCSSVLGLR